MYRFWPKQLPILLLFCSTYLRCLRCHYPAITPKCTIRTWSIGVKCLISTRNMVISSCHLKPQMVWKMPWPEVISEGLKIKKFSGGGTCPQTLLQGVLLHTVPLPPNFSLNIILPPLVYFSKWNTAQINFECHYILVSSWSDTLPPQHFDKKQITPTWVMPIRNFAGLYFL